MTLIIVESPTKARTLSRFLGEKYKIMATMGHIRDLPPDKLGVDIAHDFMPTYEVSQDRKATVSDLKKAAYEASDIVLATDPDREGEAIAYHTKELINSKQKFSRIIFHEITEEAVKEAILSPRDIDIQLVNAQQARRILDRLVGYKLSPLLWRKIRKGLSAGRVQSVAVRLVVEREREIQAFKPVEYWEVEAQLAKIINSKLQISNENRESFKAKLIKIDDQKVEIHNKDEAELLVSTLNSCKYTVFTVETRETRRYSYPPFNTSTLQQGAANRLGWSAKRTMKIAQQLYEEGFITYMRTDSFNLSEEAISKTRKYIETQFGPDYLPVEPKRYKTKSKVAQEAHEAVRPSNINISKNEVAEKLGRDAERLYDLIFKRMVACQMNEAVYDSTTVDVQAKKQTESKIYLFRAVGSVMKFPGWLKVYMDGDKNIPEDGEQENKLPPLVAGEVLRLVQLLPSQHFTEPPPRYTEATLIKALEERGIGRPSTYAPTMSTIQDRHYIEKVDPAMAIASKGQFPLANDSQGKPLFILQSKVMEGRGKTKKLIPTPIGFAVNDFLVEHFSDVVDYGFTAQMEDELDDIANGNRQWIPVIRDFYDPFAQKLKEVQLKAKRVAIAAEETNEKCPKCSAPVVIRTGRFGKFYACSTYPKCDYTKQYRQTIGMPCPKCGGDIIIKYTKTRKTFYGCSNYPKCDFASWTKPKSESTLTS
jgi:DNA topoisomerase-1